MSDVASTSSRGQNLPTASRGQNLPTAEASNERENVGDFAFKPIEDLLMDTLPQKSVSDYKKAWQKFLSEMSISKDEVPCEADYLRYFEKLRRVSKYKGSTLWTLYSKLNAVHQRLYGKITFFFSKFKWSFLCMIQVTDFKIGRDSRSSSCHAEPGNLSKKQPSLSMTNWWLLQKTAATAQNTGSFERL